MGLVTLMLIGLLSIKMSFMASHQVSFEFFREFVLAFLSNILPRGQLPLHSLEHTLGISELGKSGVDSKDFKLYSLTFLGNVLFKCI